MSKVITLNVEVRIDANKEQIAETLADMCRDNQACVFDRCPFTFSKEFDEENFECKLVTEELWMEAMK